MAYAGSRFDSTNLAAVINEVWSPRIQQEFTPNLLAADLFRDVSPEFDGGGSKVYIPGVYSSSAQLSVKSKAGGDEIDLQSASMDEDTLTIDTWKEISFIIEDMEAQKMLQSANVDAEYTRQATKKLAKDLDSTLLTSVTSGADYTEGGSGRNLTDALIRLAISDLAKNDVPLDELFFIFGEQSYWQDLMSEDRYIQNYVAGYPQGQTPVITGNFGNAAGNVRGVLYGIPVYATTQTTGSSQVNNLLAHRDAATFAIRTPGGGRVRSEAEYDFDKKGTKWSNDIIYGTSSLRTDTAVKIVSNVGSIES